LAVFERQVHVQAAHVSTGEQHLRNPSADEHDLLAIRTEEVRQLEEHRATPSSSPSRTSSCCTNSSWLVTAGVLVCVTPALSTRHCHAASDLRPETLAASIECCMIHHI
jgi:hypothetical protein